MTFWSELWSSLLPREGRKTVGSSPLPDTYCGMPEAALHSPLSLMLWPDSLQRLYTQDQRISTRPPNSPRQPVLPQPAVCVTHSPPEKRSGRMSQMKIWLCQRGLATLLKQHGLSLPSLWFLIFSFAVFDALLHFPEHQSQTGGHRYPRL